MINKTFKNAVNDFVERAGEIPNLVCAILFGSALESEISKKSDIDVLLLFDCDHNPEIGLESKKVHKIASEICSEHDLAHSFSFVFVNKQNLKEVEPDFLWNVLNRGIMIWGKPGKLLFKQPHPSLEPKLLVTFSIKGLEEKKRRGLMRSLYGYSGKRGIIDKGVERLGPGSIVINANKEGELKLIFEKYGLKNCSMRKIWG